MKTFYFSPLVPSDSGKKTGGDVVYSAFVLGNRRGGCDQGRMVLMLLLL